MQLEMDRVPNAARLGAREDHRDPSVCKPDVGYRVASSPVFRQPEPLHRPNNLFVRAKGNEEERARRRDRKGDSQQPQEGGVVGQPEGHKGQFARMSHTPQPKLRNVGRPEVAFRRDP